MMIEEEINAKTVDEYLNECSYENDAHYVPSEFALKFVSFIKLVNGREGESNKTPVLHYKMLDKAVAPTGKDLINLVHRGAAKALSVDSQVLTPNGNVRMGELRVGDTVISRNGLPTKITHKSEVFNKPMFKINLEDGRSLEVSEDHLNIVLKRKTGKNVSKEFIESVLTTQELISKGVVYNRKVGPRTPKGYESKWYIPTSSLVEFIPKSIPLDPYTIGCILGDGSIDKTTGFTRFHTHEDDLNHFLTHLQGADISSVRNDYRRTATVRFSLKGMGKKVKEYIGTENVYSKRIPQDILWSSSEHRLAVLRGLMDTDGTVAKTGGADFCTVSEELANDVLWLARSLGFEAKLGESAGYYRVHIYADICPFLLPRKADKWIPNKKGMIAIKSITPMELVESQCIAVDDPTHSFLAESFVVTHNTTLLGEYLFLYLAVFGELDGFGKVPFAIYVSDSMDNGVKNMRKNLEFRRENSEFLMEWIPSVRFTDITWEFTNKAGNKLVVKGYGAKTGVRGAKAMGKRPVLAVLDDLISDEDARSPTVIASVEDTIYKAIDYALDPTRRKIIWSGTPFNAKDPLYKAVESGAWEVNVYPVCERFPCTKEEFRGSWEDRFSYDFVLKQYEKAKKSGKIDTFNQELMLRIMSDDDRVIFDSDIQWYYRRDILKNMGAYNFYITTDFATSEKTSADYSVISVWAINSKGYWFYVDGICKRQLMNDNIDDLFRLAQEYQPQSVGIEVTGQQGGFIPWIRQEMIDRKIYFNLASENNTGNPGIRPVTQKFTRFMTMVPLFKQHQIFFPLEMKEEGPIVEAVNELSLVAKGGFKAKHDDFIDTISMLSSMKAWRPSEETQMKYDEHNDIWAPDTFEVSGSSLDSYMV